MLPHKVQLKRFKTQKERASENTVFKKIKFSQDKEKNLNSDDMYSN